MPSRVAAIFCLVLVVWSVGCRKALAPSTLTNQPPETWIVAAPQDTITTRDADDRPVPPAVGRIPVRFHMYWAGTDRDGTVAGFFWAVVETLPVQPEGSSTVPALPGPKARDYHFTTRTDSIFNFSAAIEVSERQHAFFIYAVDDKGRADPTPARFIFSAYDRFPPAAVIDECKATGFEYQLLPPPAGGVMPIPKTYLVTDFFEISNAHPFPRDTVMSGARLHMRWHGESTIPGTVVTGYRYKLDETTFNTVDSSVHEASYNTGVGSDRVNSGKKKFTLQAVGRSGWRGEATRWFQMNFAPDSWFAGPDPNDAAARWRTLVDGNGKRYWFMDFGTQSWKDAFAGVPGSMLSVDSAYRLPPLRTERKTFFEAYNQRLWLRQEGDTVHLNSWVIIPSGGFDRDSPYAVRSNMALFGDSLRQYPVLTPGLANGSPIGFRIRVQVRDASGQLSQPTETTTYPVVDPTSTIDARFINGYQGLNTAGKAYAVVRAEDGDGTVDERLEHQPGGAAGVADDVDDGSGTPEQRALRSKVLTFYVNHAPVLLRNQANFYPSESTILTRHVGPPDSPAFNLPARDDDWYDPRRPAAIGGTPTTYGMILRWKLAIRGRLVGADHDTCFTQGLEFTRPDGISFTIPDWIEAGAITVHVRLCDCADCDQLQGDARCPFTGREARPNEGTCVETVIPCRLAGPAPGPAGSGGR